jgi:cell wall-associated NlpC family hydrolase
MELADLIGIPYRPHGRDEKGVDCFGLIWIIAGRRGTPIPDVWHEKIDPATGLAKAMKVHKVNQCEPGCVIEMEDRGRPHLGYAIDGKRMIHATMRDGVCVDDIGALPVRGYYGFD